MPCYTLFVLDPRSGRTDQFAKYQAVDDETAIGVAARLSRHRSTELWSEHRQVEIFKQPFPSVANHDERPLP